MTNSDPAPLPIQRAVDCKLTSGPFRSLPKPRFPEEIGFLDVLERRTSSLPTEELGLADLSSLLWFGARCHRAFRDQAGVLRQKRSYPSAGGVYETELLVVHSKLSRVELYDAIGHSLVAIEVDDDGISSFGRVVRELLQFDATVLVLAAHTCALNSAYSNESSLIWRNAGCLMNTLHLTSCALGLSSTHLGVLGGELVGALPSSCGNFVAAGILVVGTGVA